MLSNFWKNKLEEEKNLKALQNLYKNGQYGSSYIDIPLLEKRRVLVVTDGRGNPLKRIAVLDELLKIGAINGKSHERICKIFLI